MSEAKVSPVLQSKLSEAKARADEAGMECRFIGATSVLPWRKRR